MKPLFAVLAFSSLLLAPAEAQIFDTTGNGLLQGDYAFRHVVWAVGTNFGDFTSAVMLNGTISFNGKGSYTITSTGVSSSGGSQAFSTTGSYQISASGFGIIQNPLSTSLSITGSVANGVFIGSSTEAGNFNDLFIAAKTSGATNSSFSGNYKLAYMNVPVNASVASAYDGIADIAADGNGNISTVPIRGWIANKGTTPYTINESGVKYTFSNGVGQISFPTTQNLAIQGNKFLFLSPDGNFIFGGGSNAFDFFVGVRRAASGSALPFLDGLYYESSFNMDASNVATLVETQTSYGSFKAGGEYIIGHTRYNSIFRQNTEDRTYDAVAPAPDTEQYTDVANQIEYTVSRDANYRIGVGVGPFLGIYAATRSPSFSGSGVYLNPTGIINAASFAPFTTGIARGELLLLYGSNLAPDFAIADTTKLPLPNKLNNVQVLINNIAAPIYYVRPDVIAAIVPYGVTTPVVQLQVVNNGQNSNAVTVFRKDVVPGVLSFTQNGAGYALAQHADYSLITPDHPVRPGETIIVYMTGLGDVFPTIQDGAAGASGSQLNSTPQDAIAAFVGGTQADVPFSGLAPGLAALYQLNVTIPSDATDGDKYLTVCGATICTNQVKLPVSTQQ